MTSVYLVILHDDSAKRMEYKCCASKSDVKSVIENDAEYHSERIDGSVFGNIYEDPLPKIVLTLSNPRIWWEIRDMEVIGAYE